MTDISPVRFLTKEGAGDADALALKVFSGSVLEAFVSATKFWDNTGNIISTKQLDSGKSAQWPIIGQDPTPEYHTPGDFMGGGSLTMSERVVPVDSYLASYVDVPYHDINLSHFDVLRPFATKLGRSLATDMDKKLARVATNAARSAAVSSVHSGGNRVTRSGGGSAVSVSEVWADSSTGSGAFRDDVATLARNLDEDAVPEGGRYLFITPYIRSIMRHEVNLFDRDYNTEDVAGTMNNRIIGRMEGFNVIVSNNLPTTDNTSDADLPDQYEADCDGGSEAGGQPAAIALCGAQEGQPAIGLVQAAGLTSHIERDERRNTYFLKSQMMVGADYIAPWCAGTIEWFL